MKFFPELASCWGGVIVTPAAEAGGGGRRTEEQGGYYHTHGHQTSKRLVKVKPSGGAVTHWKPMLNSISEDSPMPEVHKGGVNRRMAGIDDKKRPVKVKPKSLAKVASPPNHIEDYWKSSQEMAPPAFSPMSFLF